MCPQVFHIPQLDANIFQCHIWDGCQVVILFILSALDGEFSLTQGFYCLAA